MQKYCKTLAAVLLAISTNALAENQHSKNSPSEGILVLPPTVMHTCAPMPPATDIFQVVRIKIPDNLGIKSRRIFVPDATQVSKSSEDDDDPVVSIDQDYKSTKPEFRNNPYHIDLTVFTPNIGENKHYMELRFVLDDNLAFDTSLADPNAPPHTDPTIYGISGGGTLSSDQINGSVCTDLPILHLKGTPKQHGGIYAHDVAIMYVKYKDRAVIPFHPPVDSPIIIAVHLRSAPETPIIIDPKVENNG